VGSCTVLGSFDPGRWCPLESGAADAHRRSNSVSICRRRAGGVQPLIEVGQFLALLRGEHAEGAPLIRRLGAVIDRRPRASSRILLTSF
jgi:hypothetical protein